MGMRYSLRISVLLVGTILFGGCSHDNGPLRPGPEEEHTNRGWDYFERGDYGNAADQFRIALRHNTEFADAHLGLGWSQAVQESLSAALGELGLALQYGTADSLDARSGLAITQFASNLHTDAVLSAEAVLRSAPKYVFEHRPDVDFMDLHLVRATSLVHLGIYDRIGSSLDVMDPLNQLEISDPSTWIVEGVVYATYAEAVVAELERCRRLVR